MSEPSEETPDRRPSIELLESVHSFPGTYRIKVIGRSEGDFANRAADEARAELGESAVNSRSLLTGQGRHVSVTLDLDVQSAEQVRAIYARLLTLEGLVLLL